jgi:hypothetical protein
MTMKYLFALILSATAVSAQADDVMLTMPNQQGGAIEISDIKCTNGMSGSLAHSYSDNSKYDTPDIFGCAKATSRADGGYNVVIVWTLANGSTSARTYNMSNFTATAYGKKKYGDNK